MEEYFNKFKKSFKLKLILTTIIYILIVASLIVLSIIFKKVYLYWLSLFAAIFVFPVLFLLINIGFNKKRDYLITNMLDEANIYGFDIKLYGKVDGDEIELLKLNEISEFFSISNIVSHSENERSLLAYTVKFESNKKRVIGKIIKVTYPNSVNQDFSKSYLKNANFMKKIKIVGNNLYIFVADYIKNKTSGVYSLEPLDFKSYDELKSRIDNEFKYFKELLEK